MWLTLTEKSITIEWGSGVGGRAVGIRSCGAVRRGSWEGWIQIPLEFVGSFRGGRLGLWSGVLRLGVWGGVMSGLISF